MLLQNEIFIRRLLPKILILLMENIFIHFYVRIL